MIKYQQNYNLSKYKGIMYNIEIYPYIRDKNFNLVLVKIFHKQKTNVQMELSATVHT